MLRLLQSIFGLGDTTGGYPEDMVRKAIERAVDGTDPWLRAISGYRKKAEAGGPARHGSCGYPGGRTPAAPPGKRGLVPQRPQAQGLFPFNGGNAGNIREGPEP